MFSQFILNGIKWENNLLVIIDAGIEKLSGDSTNYFRLKCLPSSLTVA